MQVKGKGKKVVENDTQVSDVSNCPLDSGAIYWLIGCNLLYVNYTSIDKTLKR